MQKNGLNQKHFMLIDDALQKLLPNQSWALESELGGGLSTSTLYQVTVAEKQYVVRLTAPEDRHNNLPHEYAVMAIVNKLGIVPHLHYADIETGIVITDFVQSQPLFPWSNEQLPLPQLLADVARTLHRGPTLPQSRTIFDKAVTIFGWLPAAFQSASPVVEAITFMQSFEPLMHDPAHLRPTHGDINPGNLLFDGRQFWLIDWASAGQDNFYFDLASSTIFFFYQSEAAETAFLRAYFEREPTVAEMSIYARVSTFCRIYYGLIFLYMSVLRGAALLNVDEVDALPDYPTFMGLIGAGKESLDDPLSQQRLGFVYLQWAARLLVAL